MISLRDIALQLGNGRALLAGVSLDLRPGEMTGLVGANGSGKSTLGRLVAGLVRPSHGSIDRGGHRVCMVMQDPSAQFLGATVEEDIAFGPEMQGLSSEQIRQGVDDILRRFDLQSLRMREPATLSGGQQQRLGFAAAVATGADVLVCDEVTGHLDAEHRAGTLHQARQLADDGTALLWITHHSDELAVCDQVLVLVAGAVAFAGDPREFVESDLLPQTGLELPAAARFARLVNNAGRRVGSLPLDEAELVGQLCGS